MTQHVYSRNARADLVELAAYLGQDSAATAERFLVAVEKAVRRLAEAPGIGAPIDHPNSSFAGATRWQVPGFRNP